MLGRKDYTQEEIDAAEQWLRRISHLKFARSRGSMWASLGSFQAKVQKMKLDQSMANPNYGSIIIRGARENNLKNVSLDIPKRRITVFTGVSGSGKSSLVFSPSPRKAKG